MKKQHPNPFKTLVLVLLAAGLFVGCGLPEDSDVVLDENGQWEYDESTQDWATEEDFTTEAVTPHPYKGGQKADSGSTQKSTTRTVRKYISDSIRDKPVSKFEATGHGTPQPWVPEPDPEADPEAESQGGQGNSDNANSMDE